ncbi:Centromere protein Cenp-O [Penicillium brevicompactum]|uniref:Centromere protein Cenp-O n=1 Tax=Penicillium brevicompactum TaxID=5074 RepID=A0A9W9RCJ5_PENBR|nr:Centromere protein Cenp-O [Penicillium brevicompactum]
MQRATPDPEEEALDTEIASIHAEIRNLQKRKRILTSSLLTTDPIQKLLRKSTANPTQISDLSTLSPLAQAADKHNTSNHHRIAFGATAFPFKDPNPSATTKNLLGVRIDVCARNGRFSKPYYILLRTDRGTEKRLRVHRHTIPAFISIAKLEGAYLPRAIADDDAELAKPWKGAVRRQDLQGFVRELRRELVGWHMRVDAVEFLREKLGLVDEEGRAQPFDVSPDRETGVVSLAAASLEARYVRLEWEDGRVGRFKLSNSGIVERAVVIGDQGRDKKTEDAMTGGGGRVETVLDRLRVGGSGESVGV